MAKKVTDTQIIDALLQCHTQQEAAIHLSISPQTIVNRMKKPEFVQRYHEAQNEILRSTTRKLSSGSEYAAGLLIDTMQDTDESINIRIATAKDVLKLARDFNTLDELQRRLSLIEQRIEEAELEQDDTEAVPYHSRID